VLGRSWISIWAPSMAVLTDHLVWERKGKNYIHPGTECQRATNSIFIFTETLQWRGLSFGMQRRVVRWKLTGVSCWLLAWLTLQHWRWRWHAPPKRRLLSTDYTALYPRTIAVRTWNPTRSCVVIYRSYVRRIGYRIMLMYWYAAPNCYLYT
jgi:hypothetical protein